MTKQPSYTVKKSEVLLDAPIIAVRRDTIDTATGDAEREIVEHFSAVAVVAVKDDCIRMVRQYRHAVGDYLWELPAGLLDKVGEDPLTAAQRELAEEANVEADTWALLGDFSTSPGFAEESVRIFLAEDIHNIENDDLDLDEQVGEEADLETRWVPVAEVLQWLKDGRLRNSIAVAGVSFFNLGVRRDVTEPFEYYSGLAARRRQLPDAHEGADMKFLQQ